MAPIISNITNFIPVQTTLVATSMPETNALRVPIDNVPPSVSNAQVNNNARGNSGAAPTAQEQAATATVAVEENAVPFVLSNASARLSANAQPAFLAQLMSQDVPSSLQSTFKGTLAQYEKMVAYSFVKYKPSNANMPAPAPSGVFGKILQEEKVADKIEALKPAVSAAQTAPAEPIATNGINIAPVRSVAPTPSRQVKEAVEAAAEAPEEMPVMYIKPLPIAQVTSAYAATVSRNDAVARNSVESV